MRPLALTPGEVFFLKWIQLCFWPQVMGWTGGTMREPDWLMMPMAEYFVVPHALVEYTMPEAE